MTTRHCRHFWMPCSETLRESFPRFSDESRTFRVCVRCLRIEELEPVVVDAEAGPESGAEVADGDRQAA